MKVEKLNIIFISDEMKEDFFFSNKNEKYREKTDQNENFNM